ncbi:MAG: hypothetical protein HXY20_08170 [Acidobacteria bacterium]|nr:hypothetical protein [Acidobacteriota bacterium]
MRILIASMSGILCFMQLNLAQTEALPETTVDSAVDSKGTLYILTQRSLRVQTAGGARSETTLAPSLAVADSGFTREILHAIAVDRNDEPTVLWSGMRGNGSVDTFVTRLNTKAGVRLGLSFGTARSLSISSTGDIYVLGLARDQEPLLVAHQFTATGLHVRSFHPFLGSSASDLEARRKQLSRARIAAGADAVYLLFPFLSNAVYEYRQGTLAKAHDFEGVNGPGRKVLSIFSNEGNVLLHSVVNGETGEILRHEILNVADGAIVRSFSAREIAGPVLGMTPDGRVICRDATVGPSRDSISHRR